MKKRNLMLLSAIAAASILMTGCGFTADDPADSQAVTITPEPTATPAHTATPAPTVTPTANLTTTPAPAGTDASSTTPADGTTTDGTASTDSSTSSDAASTDTSSDSASSTASASSGDASSYVGSTLNEFMNIYGTPVDYEPAYDANGNEVGGVYSFNDFSITTDFTSGSETVEAVDYY